MHTTTTDNNRQRSSAALISIYAYGLAPAILYLLQISAHGVCALESSSLYSDYNNYVKPPNLICQYLTGTQSAKFNSTDQILHMLQAIQFWYSSNSSNQSLKCNIKFEDMSVVN